MKRSHFSGERGSSISPRSKLITVAVLFIVSLFLSACGGGGGGGSTKSNNQANPSPNQNPSVADADSDGITDAQDTCPATPAGASVDTNGCASSQIDNDNDGVSNAADLCASTPAGQVIDAVGCSATQLDPARCHTPAGSTGGSDAPYVSAPITTKLELEGQYFKSSIREFRASATGPDHAQDAITIYNGKMYAAYYGKQGVLKLARKPISSCVWTTITFPYTQTDPDSHRAAVVGISPNDGRIHVVWGLHGNSNIFNYIVSKSDNAVDVDDAAFTADLFEARKNQLRADDTIRRVTYPRFIAANDNNLLLFWRKGGSGNGDIHMAEYENGEWSKQRPVLSGTSGKVYEGSSTRNAYLNTVTYGNNQLHITWTWRENPNGNSNHDLMHAYSLDNGLTWLNNAGVVVGTNDGLTIDLESDVLFEEARDGTVANQCGQTATSDGRVHVIHRYSGAYQYHRWGPSPSDTTWTAGLDIGTSGGRPRIYSGPKDSLWVVGLSGNKIRIHAALKENDNWTNWKRVYESPSAERYISSTGYVEGDDLVILAQREAEAPTTAESSEIEVLRFKLND